jgi:phosphoribosyl 1,2-cyclic phosphodiesterase
MRISFCGVRGSTPAPGAEFIRTGGQTSCIAVAPDDGPVNLVLDAGTGLRRLSRDMNGTPFDGTILVSHLHWDHTHGIPFFRAGDSADARVRLLIPAQEETPQALMARIMSPPHFPVTLDQLNGNWSVDFIDEGTHEISGFSVLAREIPHKGSRTFGYRVSDGHSSIAYMPDHMPTGLGPGPDGIGEYHESAMALVKDVDLLIHDAQYTTEELPTRGSFGHSAAEYVVALGERAGAHAVALFHHDPDRTDEQVDEIADRVAKDAGCEVIVAREGVTLSL